VNLFRKAYNLFHLAWIIPTAWALTQYDRLRGRHKRQDPLEGGM
jgi:hypothetical protein